MPVHCNPYGQSPEHHRTEPEVSPEHIQVWPKNKQNRTIAYHWPFSSFVVIDTVKTFPDSQVRKFWEKDLMCKLSYLNSCDLMLLCKLILWTWVIIVGGCVCCLIYLSFYILMLKYVEDCSCVIDFYDRVETHWTKLFISSLSLRNFTL